MPKKVDPALKCRALRMVAEHRSDYPSMTGSACTRPKPSPRTPSTGPLKTLSTSRTPPSQRGSARISTIPC